MTDLNQTPAPTGAYSERLDAAARRACSSYLDAIGMEAPVRRFAEYDALTDDGRQVWRRLVTRALYDMLPVIRDATLVPAEETS